jgi:hypothetical protein
MSRPFNLDELLGPEHVQHYLRFITPTRDNILGSQLPPPRYADYWEPEEPLDSRPRWVPAATSADDGIERRGYGAEYCSSSFELAVPRPFVWDVCGYYRTLGVSADATRLQLREGAIRNGGADSLKVNYALKQLLNPVIRRLYDAALPTEPFIHDRETMENLKRAALRQAARESWESGEEVTLDDVLARQGYRQTNGDEPAGGRTEVPGWADQDDADKPSEYALGGTISPWLLKWSWYAWEPPMGFRGYWDPAPLARWQDMLRREFSALGVSMSFAVGLFEGDGWKLFRLSGGLCIVFLARGEFPDEELAASAAAYTAETAVNRGRQHGSTHRSSRVRGSGEGPAVWPRPDQEPRPE